MFIKPPHCRRTVTGDGPARGGSMSLDVPVSLVASLLSLIIVIFGLAMVGIRLLKSGWGPYTLQALGLVLLIPALLILAAFDILSDEIIATLLGGVAGYVFGRGNDGEKKESA
jgi:hypothetical protein